MNVYMAENVSPYNFKQCQAFHQTQALIIKYSSMITLKLFWSRKVQLILREMQSASYEN